MLFPSAIPNAAVPQAVGLFRIRGAAILAALTFALTSCGSGGGGDVTPTNPAPVAAPAPFDFTFPQTGQSVQLAFPNAGTFGYRCRKHVGQGMSGSVTVGGSGADSAVVSVGAGGNLVFSPASVSIKAGGTVRWVNVSARTDHTLTSN